MFDFGILLYNIKLGGVEDKGELDPIGEIYAQVAKSATSYYSLIVLPLTNFTLHPLTWCVIDKRIKRLVKMIPYGNALLFQYQS